MRWSVRALLCATPIVALAGCRLANDLLPRTHTTSTSPDGRYVAFVHQTIFGTHGRPIHRREQLLGRERLRIPLPARTVEVVPATPTR